MLVFEDLQWADTGLLEFIDYLLEWSADRPLFILGCGRSELLESRPAWSERAVQLGPLGEDAMREALDGLVPGLPEELTGRIMRRAEGVPLYAIETVRMLLDRGLLAQDGPRYVLTADVSELDVPETLHALVAARLDGLTGGERSVLQDASVFGQSFTATGVAALSTRSAEEIQSTLSGLVAKQLLGINDDPLSSERGQYHFLQGLVRTTAYGTLSRRDRKARHLAAARHLQESWGDAAPEMAEILAAHFLDAAAADPEAADAARIRTSACETLAEAGRRALSLALGKEAQRAFDRAAELAADDPTRAVLLDQAGRAALMNSDLGEARARLERAVEIFESLDDHESAASAMNVIGTVLFREDRLDEAIQLQRDSVPRLAENSVERAVALAELSLNLAFAGELEEALAAADAALAIAEPQQAWAAVCTAFNGIALTRSRQGRREEGRALLERSLALALANDLSVQALRAYNNIGDIPLQVDRFAEAIDYAQLGHELAQARGDRIWEGTLALMVAAARVGLGRWDELDLDAMQVDDLLRASVLILRARVHAARGQRAPLERILAELDELGDVSNLEFAATPAVARTIALRALGEDQAALDAALPVALDVRAVNEDRREAYIEAGLAALALGDEATLERLIAFVDELTPARRSPLMRAGAARFAGLLAQRRGDLTAADERLFAAIRELREIEAPFVLAQVLVEHAEVLARAGRVDEAALAVVEASTILERLRAAPWLERARAVTAAVAA
jgi:tetratricopeptide (TPR) repeat protein